MMGWKVEQNAAVFNAQQVSYQRQWVSSQPTTTCECSIRGLMPLTRAQIYFVCNRRGIRFCSRARRDIHGHVSFGLFAKMAPLPDGFPYGQWGLVYNALFVGIRGMGSATIFFWLQLPNVTKNYRTALRITGLVTAIAKNKEITWRRLQCVRVGCPIP